MIETNEVSGFNGTDSEADIIAAYKKTHEEKYKSIFLPMTYIGGIRYHFAEREIQETGIVVQLPTDFLLMPDEIAKMKYPSEERPEIIISSVDMSVNFTYSLLPIKTSDEELTDIRNSMLESLKKLYPQNTYMESSVGYTKESRLFTWFEFYGPTLDVEIYTAHAITRIKQGILHAMFNCPRSEYESWKPVMLEVWASIAENKSL